MRAFILCGLLLALAGCKLPQTTVRSGSAQPGLIVSGAPAGAMLVVDGVQIGPAGEYNGHPKVLNVLEGVHKVEIRTGTTLLYSERALLSAGETHVVTVIGGGAQ